MSFKQNNGIADVNDGGRYNVFGTATWGDLSSKTWESWNDWVTDPLPILYVNLPVIDLGSVQTVNIKTNIEARGIVHYTINYGNSPTITFSPDNFSTLTIDPGDTDIPSITARYIWLRVDLHNDPVQGHQYFDNIDFVTTTETKSFSYSNIDSATLPGTSASRTYSISGIGGIRSAQVTSQGGSNYNVDMYVYHDTTSTEAFPKVLAKGAGYVDLTFIGVDGRPRDAVFDIEIQALPEWYIDSTGNLLER